MKVTLPRLHYPATTSPAAPKPPFHLVAARNPPFHRQCRRHLWQHLLSLSRPTNAPKKWGPAGPRTYKSCPTDRAVPCLGSCHASSTSVGARAENQNTSCSPLPNAARSKSFWKSATSKNGSTPGGLAREPGSSRTAK